MGYYITAAVIIVIAILLYIGSLRSKITNYSITYHRLDKHCVTIQKNLNETSDAYAQLLVDCQNSYKIVEGDEVNSFHSAIMRKLNQEQMIALRDKLIRRTPNDSVS